MKPLPIEQPKETDFKSKVIELIEKRIELFKKFEKESLENGYEHNAIEYRVMYYQFSQFLEQIKQL
jgi:hypothetical protein